MQPLTHKLSPLQQTRRTTGVTLAGSTRQLSGGDQATLKQILTGKYEFVKNPIFGRSNAQRKLFEEVEEIAQPDTSWYHPVMDRYSDAEHRRGRVQGGTVLLTASQERVLFLQFNYCRYRVCKLRDRLCAAGNGFDADQAIELLAWHRRAEQLHDQIAQTNLALVLAMGKRTRMSEVDFGDLVSEGNMALLRAIDKFDVARGFKFSTYACRAILKAFSRAGVKLSRYRGMFPTDFDPALERSDYADIRRAAIENDCADEIKHIINDNRAELSNIEQEVIEHRFAIGRKLHREATCSPMTLEQVGKIIGVTKERVRQIQNKALEKIRQSLEEDYLG